MAEADIIQNDDQHIGGASRGLIGLGKSGFEFFEGRADLTLESGIGNRQDRSVDRIGSLSRR